MKDKVKFLIIGIVVMVVVIITDTSEMFANCTNLTKIYVSERWDTSNVSNSWQMFDEDYDLTNYDKNNDNDKTNAHYGAGGY